MKQKDMTRTTGKKIGRIVGRCFAVLGVTLGVLVAGLYAVMVILTHGPSPAAKELFVLSVRESSAGGFLASMVCSPEEIAAIEAKNNVQDAEGVSDSSLVVFKPDQKPEEVKPPAGKTPYLTENGIQFYQVRGGSFAGTMMVIPDASRVFVGASGDYRGEPGINVPAICEKYGAVLATNAGGFDDPGGVGNGGTPKGIVISEGKLKWGNMDESYSLIGFDKDNVFVIGNMTARAALNRGVRDAVSFGPFLILNGNPLAVSGMGGGLNPRTAIGQRADGAVLLLVVDGRQTHSLGATMNDLINVMLDFDAVNAANLDGGGSTVLYYNGEIQNKISSIYGARGVPTAILVRPQESGDGQ